jgi:hypothetical protein
LFRELFFFFSFRARHLDLLAGAVPTPLINLHLPYRPWLLFTFQPTHER